MTEAAENMAPAGRWTAAAVGWLAWGAAIVALTVPSTVALTTLRIVVPLAPVTISLALLSAWHDANAVRGVVSLAIWGVAEVCLLHPATAGHMCDSSSYGTERRFPLRIPGPLMLGPVQLAWLAAVGGPVAGPLLVGAGAGITGWIVLLVGLPTSLFSVRALHSLARRWIVFVPAGMVIHDPITLEDPVLLQRRAVESIGPAPEGSGSLDLTAGAWGLALEARLREPVTVRTRGGAVRSVTGVLFTPTLPADLLDEARSRKLPVR